MQIAFMARHLLKIAPVNYPMLKEFNKVNVVVMPENYGGSYIMGKIY